MNEHLDPVIHADRHYSELEVLAEAEQEHYESLWNQLHDAMLRGPVETVSAPGFGPGDRSLLPVWAVVQDIVGGDDDLAADVARLIGQRAKHGSALAASIAQRICDLHAQTHAGIF